MSDTSILPGATPAAADPGVPPPPGLNDEPGGGDDRRRLLILGGIVGAVVLIAAAYFLLKGGGGSSDNASGLIPRATPTSTVASGGDEASAGRGSTAAGHHKPGDVLPKKSTTRLARDPFKPLVSVAAAGTGTVVGSTTASPGDTAGLGASSGSASPTTGTPPEANLGTPHAIRLIRVEGHKGAVFEVYYAKHKAFRYEVLVPEVTSTQGTVFAKEFALLGVQGNEATVQVGDDTPFDLRSGVLHQV